MTDLETKHKIEAALKTFSLGNLSENALALFSVLGYNTDRQAPLDKPNYANFKETFFISQSKFNEEKARVKDWQYVDLLFQLSKEEIRKQISLFDTKKVDQTIIETYLFFAISLSQDQYSRTELSNITREVNRLFPMPVMILFKHGQYLTLAVINRRQHKRDENKDVLEKITLIKDIRIENPHRAHVEILFDLSFDELQSNYGFTNFVELHNAWQKTLDTKELNKRFYLELSNWYFWAMKHVSFPDDVEKDESIRNATSLIRLITRIIFIWFIKEKNLVPDTLFDRREMGRILKAFEKNKKSDSYYRAILQNLFFGTLNQQMNERGFARDGSFLENKNNYGVKNLFRYAGDFAIAEKEVLVLFKDIPFLNGGLFDCLDKENDEDKVVYGDGFSRNPKKQAVVPDFLFFGDEEDYDLNTVYGTKNKRYKVKGLFNILSAYKFTVAENTPVEEEIALDPELLGRVFENLLASYNPETQTTARKQTGSFYTPREIVNYMVDESLKAYLQQKLEDETGIKPEDAEAGLDILFSYTEKEHAFSERETKTLITAIDNCKILDPACGSGAFPMGVLHKLVHILHKLDPQNEKWKERQISRARQLDDPAIREKTIEDIEAAFASNELDYGRKLYLIENCIYGVDIQPIAVQIAKLRFFISLIVDQKKQPEKNNLGIRSLPNLETKFVAANTLIGLDKPQTGGQISFKNPEIERLEEELKALRHQYFNARTRREKLACQRKDRDLRKKISNLLEKDGWNKDSASQVAAFDPYDQNASSPFFDPEWMFGLRDGFDVVLGNPPYKILTRNNTTAFELEYFTKKYKSIKSSYSKNLFTLFIENAIGLLSRAANLSFIVPEGLFKTRSYSGCVEEIEKNGYIKSIATFTNYVFENTITGNLIFVFINNKKGPTLNYNFDEELEIGTVEQKGTSILRQIESETKPLSTVAYLFKGMVVKDRDLVVSNNSKGKNDVFLLGKNISKWSIESKFYANYEDLEIIGGTKKLEKHNHYPRILIRRTGDTLCCAYLNEKALTESTLYSCWSISAKISNKYLIGLLNSKLLDYYSKSLFITNQQAFPQILMTDLELLPIKIANTDFLSKFVKLIDYILYSKYSFIERLIDTMVYKLYFPNQIRAADADVLKHLNDLPELKEDWTDEKKLKVIEEVYKKLSDPNHPVSIAMAKMDTIEEIRIIEGKQ